MNLRTIKTYSIDLTTEELRLVMRALRNFTRDQEELARCAALQERIAQQRHDAAERDLRDLRKTLDVITAGKDEP